MSHEIDDQEGEQQFVIARLNAKLQPMHRGEFFEDPLQGILEKHGVGEVAGGGTLQDETGEIEYCEIEIVAPEFNDNSISLIAGALQALGAPKGSHIESDAGDVLAEFGACEGMAVYLNGTELPSNVYQECDSNFVYSEFDRLVAPHGRVMSYWQGPTETAFYLYGTSYSEMQRKISEFIATYPLCQKCRVERIA